MSKDSPIAQSFNERRDCRRRARKKDCWKCRTAKMMIVGGEWRCHYCGHTEEADELPPVTDAMERAQEEQ